MLFHDLEIPSQSWFTSFIVLYIQPPYTYLRSYHNYVLRDCKHFSIPLSRIARISLVQGVFLILSILIFIYQLYKDKYSYDLFLKFSAAGRRLNFRLRGRPEIMLRSFRKFSHREGYLKIQSEQCGAALKILSPPLLGLAHYDVIHLKAVTKRALRF